MIPGISPFGITSGPRMNIGISLLRLSSKPLGCVQLVKRRRLSEGCNLYGAFRIVPWRVLNKYGSLEA